MVKRILKWIGIVILVIAVLFAVLLLVLTVTEYKPKDEEDIAISGNASAEIASGDSLTILSWNTGYCGLGNTADFFMDGGKSVRENTKSEVEGNLTGIEDTIRQEDPDVVFLQEVDKKAKRSYGINEVSGIAGAFPQMENMFAENYKVLYIPYPIPPMGHVDAGIMTLTSYSAESAERIQLPCPFSWPYRLGNLKRCLLVTRIPVQGSDKELVLVNLHLEAYDDGEGKAAQTKQLAQFLQSEYEKGNYVIAGGDFNQVFSGTDTSMYPQVSDDLWKCGTLDESQFSDSLQFEMDNSTPTCRSLDRAYKGAEGDFQYYMIDGFIVSDNVEVSSMETLDKEFEHSDHNPVEMKVTLK